MISRRSLLRAIALGAVSLPFASRRVSLAAPTGGARRLIVFYWPDGIAGRPSDGGASLWTPKGSESAFTLQEQMAPLAPWQSQTIFFEGLSLGATDSGSHPGGAKKLLTAVDGGNGESIDQLLARSVGASVPHKHLYFGAQTSGSGASSDKLVSYIGPGATATPDDDPRVVFDRLFSSGGGAPTTPTVDETQVSVIDTVLADLHDLRTALGKTEQSKLDLHLEALREVEKRVKALPAPVAGASCSSPSVDVSGLDGKLHDAATFPKIFRAQTDLMVLAMRCGLSKVGVLQGSHHTSELIMSRFAGTEMHDPAFDMRSHQASHYGAKHDFGKREFKSYYQQRRWWMSELAYLLSALKAVPEGDGTMLDYSLILGCSEVSDGNTHSHDDVPFLLCGGGGGAVRPGRFLSFAHRRHADLLLAIAHAMGDKRGSFGDASSGPLPGVLA